MADRHCGLLDIKLKSDGWVTIQLFLHDRTMITGDYRWPIFPAYHQMVIGANYITINFTTVRYHPQEARRTWLYPTFPPWLEQTLTAAQNACDESIRPSRDNPSSSFLSLPPLYHLPMMQNRSVVEDVSTAFGPTDRILMCANDLHQLTYSLLGQTTPPRPACKQHIEERGKGREGVDVYLHDILTPCIASTQKIRVTGM